MNEIEEIKISLAAKYLEVTPKTIYNWIEDGTLKKTRPGYVLKSDLEKAKIIKSEERVNTSRRIALSQVKRAPPSGPLRGSSCRRRNRW